MKAEKKMYVIDYCFEPKNNSMRISSLSTYFLIIWWTNLSYWKKTHQ